jgi:hypothetical protein
MLARVLRMPHAVWLRFALGCFMLAAAPTLFAAPREQSTSTSHQFIVYGTDVAVRGAICDLAERTKHDLLALLDQRDAWTTPIVINAQYPQANLPELPRLALNVSQTGFGLKLQLDLTIDSEISRPEVRRELLRALLLEMMYRGESNIPVGTVYTSPPDWLVDGVPAQQSDMSLDQVTKILAVPVAARTVLPLQKFLEPRMLSGLDAPGRLLYRAYSFALLDLLRHAPEGASRLAQFILDLRSASNDPIADLRSHFPGLFGSEENAEKIWEKQIARLSTDQPYQLLASAETERMLDEILRLKISNHGAVKTYQLAEFPTFRKHPSAKSVLAMLAHDLSELATRANPIYRPIISEYAEVTALLRRGKTKGLSTRLERLRGARQAVAAQMRGIDDYLNWFEATELRGPSRAFSDYMKAAESAAHPPQTKRDPISVYLDVLEAQFED